MVKRKVKKYNNSNKKYNIDWMYFFCAIPKICPNIQPKKEKEEYWQCSDKEENRKIPVLHQYIRVIDCNDIIYFFYQDVGYKVQHK